ncbi:ABC superfamily ATP binding cassette transporter permease protein [Prevotella dentalis DSM 3688]|uniref:ABC superfamily ATP binding cassette transporter permease protein n=1 Tax=Prevotella dentalis (strain ATCC 49559 / DSM 3688 / JCM 13448 / NCTC 12043 / ES 2772) TaxID=908937 RepID=F9D6L7_PREDD|nr:ABC superfamily ATP binding cassette transporter permease protein [Prevotella dentalis DSM 3688]
MYSLFHEISSCCASGLYIQKKIEILPAARRASTNISIFLFILFVSPLARSLIFSRC